MAIAYYGTDDVGFAYRIALTTGTDYIIGSGVTIGSTGSVGMLYNDFGNLDVSILVLGTVFGNYAAIQMISDNSIAATIDIGSDAAVYSSDNDAILIYAGEFSNDGFVNLVNNGALLGTDNGVAATYVEVIDIQNNGAISTTSNVVDSFAALNLLAFSVVVGNTGQISAAAGDGIKLNSDFGWFGGTFELNNTGTVTSSADAIHSDSYHDLINNSGEIFGELQLGVGENSDYAFGDTVNNSGLIFGNIFLGYGNDVVDGENGAVFGTIYGGAGDDVITSGMEDDSLQGGVGDDELHGGIGDDLLNGDDGDDFLFGDEGDDFIFGGGGADEMWGGTGVDTASYEESRDGVRVSLNAGRGWFGGAQSDTLRDIENLIGSDRRDTLIGSAAANLIQGENADDVLNGLAGNDTIFGGNGDDNILGGDGNDYLSGDRHQDKLTGGTGEDIFAYLNILDSGPAQSERDNITDFTQGQDLIDLTELGDLFFGGTAFSGTAGEIIYYHVAGGTRTVVEIDTDGDSVADFGILLSNAAHTMTAADFLFV